MIYAIWGIVIVLIAQFFWLMRLEELLEEHGIVFTEETSPDCNNERDCPCVGKD